MDDIQVHAATSRVHFLTLLVDVILDIAFYLDVQDILVLQRTCRSLKEITEMHAVWHNVIHNQILPNGLPLPLPHDVPLSRLSVANLKAAAIYVARLDQNWRSLGAKPFNMLELSPETPAAYVQFAFLVPGTAGRCLLTVTGGSTVSFWELDSHLRRSKRIGGWVVEGSILDVVCNSDPTDPATIGIGSIVQGWKVTALYHISVQIGSNRTTTLEYKEIFQMKTLGRLKLLRGNLIVFYARINSFGCLYNYRTGVSVGLETHGFANLRITCLAIEVLSDCVIIIQPTSVDLFELPEIVTRSDGAVPADEEQRPVVSARLIETKFRPVHSEWQAGAIIPYAAPYPARRSTPASRPISILIRERSEGGHIITHYHILCPPKGYEPPGPFAPRRRPEIDVRFCPSQVRSGIRQHFFQEIVVAPSSGRGLWLENATVPGMARTAERLMIFSAVPSAEGEEWPVVDIGDAETEGSVRWCARNFPEAVRRSAFCSFDDSVGRIVVATHDGRVRVLEMAPS